MPIRHLPVTLTLHGDAVFADSPRVTAVTRSAAMPPGRALRGMLSRTLRRTGAAPEVHDRLVLSGAISFSTAYPLTPGGKVCLPVPLCARHLRGADGLLIDLSDPETPLEPGLSRPIHDVVAVSEDGSLTTWAQVARVGRTRIQRDRARGKPTEPVGGLFQVSALAPGQRFQAWWRLSTDTDEEMETLLLDLIEVDGKRVALGSAKDTAHGGYAELALDLVAPGRPLGLAPLAFAEGESLWVLLRTPALVVDPDTGDYDPDALGEAVAERFAGRVSVTSVWTAPQLVGGYNAVWRGRVPEERAAAPGSVVRCVVTAPGGLDEDAVLDLENTPLGEQWIDGYGAFTILRPPGPRKELEECESLVVALGPADEEDETEPEVVTRLITNGADAICRRRLEPRVRDAAARSAQRSTHLPAASLLGRLRDPLHTAGDIHRPEVAGAALRELGALLGSLADKAARDLDETRIALHGKPRPLRDWLLGLVKQPIRLISDVPGLSDSREHLPGALLAKGDHGTADKWLKDRAATIAVQFLDEWLRHGTLTTKENA